MVAAAALGALVLVLVILLAAALAAARRRGKSGFASCAGCGGDGTSPPGGLRRGGWAAGRGPYNLQLYDAPHYYPYYESRDYMSAWDGAGRCVAYCRASEDGGCAVACR